MGNRRVIILVLLPILFFEGIVGTPLVWAETYTLAPNPGYTTETNTGVRLALTVGGISGFTTYNFTWRVTDPGGTVRTAFNSTFNVFAPSISLSVVYPRDFGSGANTNIVGNYTVRVDQTRPSNVVNVASGRFEIGITASRVYQRTFPVIVKAGGYNNGENVTVTLSRLGSPLIGFPQWTLAGSAGNVTFVWTSPPSTPLGVAYLALRGSNTFKIPADNRTVTFTPANVTVSGLVAIPGILQRTQTVNVMFSANYNSGMAVASGTAVVRLVEADSVTTHFVVAAYDPLTSSFHATYRVGLSGASGAWTAYVDPNTLDDGYGNIGPASGSNQGFAVQQAVLNVDLGPVSGTIHRGEPIPFFATVTCPDGTSLDTGTVTVTMSKDGVPFGTGISLSYVPSQGYWVGQYVVGSTDPLGQWALQVDASDSSGNRGQGTATVTIEPIAPPPQSSGLSLELFMFLGVLAAMGAGGVGVWFWKERSAEAGKTVPFENLFNMTGGEIPAKSTLLILGEDERDPSVLGLQLLSRHLTMGKNTALLSYGAIGDEAGNGLKRVGLSNPTSYLRNGGLTIIDCSGSSFKNEGSIHVKNPLDIVEVAVQLSSVFDKSARHGPVLVLLDSLGNVFSSNTARKVIGFLSFITEKVKSEDGIVVLTVTKSSVPVEGMKDLEKLADGIIELGSGKGKTKRTLSVKKSFGRQYSPPPIAYDVKTGKGIRFRE